MKKATSWIWIRRPLGSSISRVNLSSHVLEQKDISAVVTLSFMRAVIVLLIAVIVFSSAIRGRKNAVLEFKTKTDQVRGLLSSPYRERIIVSWSLNSTYIASREEHGAPTIEKRLQAAKECQKEGIVIGFHFDPLIRHTNWREGYLRTIEMLDRYIDPNRTIWISLGCLRYPPALKLIIRRRKPRTDILDGELIHGLDGKMRYFKPLRIEIYSFLREQICKWAGDYSCLYLCMESNDVWREGLGWSPQNTEGLSSFLDNRVRKLF